MKLATFKAKCYNIKCNSNFDAPVLSIFDYGEFIYGSIDGKQIRYYCGLGCDSWKIVNKIVSEILNEKHQGELGKIIQKIIGLVADRENSKAHFTQDIYCPKCHSKIKSINIDYKTGSQDFAKLTFNDFTKLNESEMRNLIAMLLK